ncbi:MAG: magnesium transporter, partial [Gemmatimonadota bacterium]|nr:magnesium transporter [Gemmatimonadota bacterium]
REQTEDVQKFGGMEALDIPYTQIGFWGMIKKRAGWLTALFLGEMLTATAMGKFEGEIEKAVVLALFVPLIISSGGNSGSQATSLIIRALALRELTLKDWWRVGLRELPSGLVLGGILGAVGIVRILLWQSFGWCHLGFDPASASAPFVATLVDVTGLVIYFSVALVLLRGTLL